MSPSPRQVLKTPAVFSAMFVMNFVHWPPPALQASAVMYLATHFFAGRFSFVSGQLAFPVSVVGMIHISVKFKSFNK